MTNEPEPNPRAGEALAADNFKRTGEWPDPTSEMLETVLFDTIWRTIKTWDVNVPHAYSGYMGVTGNHVRAIYDAVAPLLTRPLPQPSELVERCEHGVRFPHPCDDCDDEAMKPENLVKQCLEYSDTIAALRAQIAKLQADGDKLAGAGRNIMPYLHWTIGPESPGYHPTMPSAVDAFSEALTEWKDMNNVE